MATDDLTIVGITASSREEALTLADDIDELAELGLVTVHELAVANKNRHGRTKVHYITDHGTGIGAAVGAGWGALGLATVGTVAAVGALPVLVGSVLGLGFTTAIGAAIGHAFDLHHEEAREILEHLAGEIHEGRAVVFAVVDADNADALAEAMPGRRLHRTTFTREQQERIADEVASSD